MTYPHLNISVSNRLHLLCLQCAPLPYLDFHPHLRLKPPKKLRRKVTNHNIRTCPEYPLRTLKRHLLQIEHARLRRRMYHGILATDLVRCNRQVLTELFCVADDVEVLRGRLHHDDVGALGNVAADCAASEPATLSGKLIAFPGDEVSA
jgi:hypothetical protein